MLRIFGRKGELQDWAQKKGINLTYNKLEIFHGDTEMVEEGEGTPAEMMQLNLGELKRSDALGKQSIISGKLSEYLKERYPEKHQQIHAHVMSINTRALVGMLFTPGLLEEKIEQIVCGRDNIGKETVQMEDGAETKEEGTNKVERGGASSDGDDEGKGDDKSTRNKRDREAMREPMNKNNQTFNGQGKGVMLRYGRVGIQSN